MAKTVQCTRGDNCFYKGCHHAKKHTEIKECHSYEMKFIEGERHRICNCLNPFIVCKECD